MELSQIFGVSPSASLATLPIRSWKFSESFILKFYISLDGWGLKSFL